MEKFEIRNTYLELPHGDDFDFSPVPKETKNHNSLFEEESEDEWENEEEEEEEENNRDVSSLL